MPDKIRSKPTYANKGDFETGKGANIIKTTPKETDTPMVIHMKFKEFLSQVLVLGDFARKNRVNRISITSQEVQMIMKSIILDDFFLYCQKTSYNSLLFFCCIPAETWFVNIVISNTPV